MSIPRVTRLLLLLLGVLAVAAAVGYAIADVGGLAAGVIGTVLGAALVILFAALT